MNVEPLSTEAFRPDPAQQAGFDGQIAFVLLAAAAVSGLSSLGLAYWFASKEQHLRDSCVSIDVLYKELEDASEQTDGPERKAKLTRLLKAITERQIAGEKFDTVSTRVDVEVLKGRMYHQLGDVESADKAFLEAVKIAYTDDEDHSFDIVSVRVLASNCYSHFLLTQGRPEEAERLLFRAIGIAGQREYSVGLIHKLAYALALQGKYYEALHYFVEEATIIRELQLLQGENQSLSLTEVPGGLFIELEDPKNKFRTLKPSLSNALGNAYYHQARCMAALGQLAAAEETAALAKTLFDVNAPVSEVERIAFAIRQYRHQVNAPPSIAALTVAHRDYAKLAQCAYPSHRHDPLPANWEIFLEATTTAASPYDGCAFINRLSKEIVIAHKGTTMDLSGIAAIYNSALEFCNNAKDAATGTSGSQLLEAKNFKQEVENHIRAQGLPNDYRVSHTGHSWGAYLAEHLVYDSDSEAVTFESPGSLDSIANEQRGRAETLELQEQRRKKIVEYLHGPNLIDTACRHSGWNKYLVRSFRYDQLWKDKQSNRVQLTEASHFIAGIIEELRSAWKEGRPPAPCIGHWPQGPEGEFKTLVDSRKSLSSPEEFEDYLQDKLKLQAPQTFIEKSSLNQQEAAYIAHALRAWSAKDVPTETEALLRRCLHTSEKSGQIHVGCGWLPEEVLAYLRKAAPLPPDEGSDAKDGKTLAAVSPKPTPDAQG